MSDLFGDLAARALDRADAADAVRPRPVSAFEPFAPAGREAGRVDSQVAGEGPGHRVAPASDAGLAQPAPRRASSAGEEPAWPLAPLSPPPGALRHLPEPLAQVQGSPRQPGADRAEATGAGAQVTIIHQHTTIAGLAGSKPPAVSAPEGERAAQPGSQQVAADVLPGQAGAPDRPGPQLVERIVERAVFPGTTALQPPPAPAPMVVETPLPAPRPQQGGDPGGEPPGAAARPPSPGPVVVQPAVSRYVALPPMSPAKAPAAETDQELTVNVTIGRVEVRAVPAAPAAKGQRPTPPVMGLDEYLRRRSDGGRG